MSLLLSVLLAAASPAPPPASAPDPRRARTGAAVAFAGGAVMWAGAVGLRQAHPYLRRRAFAACDAAAPADRARCYRRAHGDHDADEIEFEGASYVPVIVGTGLGIYGSYLLGTARRRPLLRPRALETTGIVVLVAGALTWLVPRSIMSVEHPASIDPGLRASEDPTFYAGFALVGVGASLLTYGDGARRRAAATRPTATVRVAGPRLVLSGRF